MLSVKSYSFNYGDKRIIDDINLEFNEGHIYGIVGANGAGKTSFLKTLANIMYATEGTIEYNGKSIINNKKYIQEVLLLDQDCFVNSHTFLSLLDYIATNKEISYDKEDVKFYINKYNIKSNENLNTVSKGNLRIAYLAIIFVLKLKIVILDEFLDGIDMVNRKMIKDDILNYVYENNAIVIISSHTISDIADLCDYITLLKDEKVTHNLEIDDMRAVYISYQLALNNHYSKDDFEELGLKVFGYKAFENIRWITIKNNDEQVKIINDLDVIDKQIIPSTLEEVIYNEFTS